MIETQVDLIVVLSHHPLLCHAVLMIDLDLPIPLPWFVCRRPVFPADGYLEMLNKAQFYGIFRLFLNLFYASM